MKKSRLVLLCVALWSLQAFASTVRYAVITTAPLALTLPIGVDKVLLFSHPVKVLVPDSTQSRVTVSSTAGKVTLHAQKAFAVARFEIVDKQTHRVMLFDMNAKQGASSATLALLPQAPQSVNVNDKGYLHVPSALKGEMAYVTLTRFAEQQLYAPKRLQKDPYGISLVKTYVKPGGGIASDTALSGLFLDGSVTAVPWATWEANGLTVTAVMVRNMLTTPLRLTHSLPLICGRTAGLWRAVTFFPRWTLGARGTKTDTSVAFLISTKAFSRAAALCKGAS